MRDVASAGAVARTCTSDNVLSFADDDDDTSRGDVVMQGEPRRETTYPEFVASAWRAGVLSYEVDLAARTCAYRSASGRSYLEHYPAVDVDDATALA